MQNIELNSEIIKKVKKRVAGALCLDIRNYWRDKVDYRIDLIESLGYPVPSKFWKRVGGIDGRYFRDDESWYGPYGECSYKDVLLLGYTPDDIFEAPEYSLSDYDEWEKSQNPESDISSEESYEVSYEVPPIKKETLSSFFPKTCDFIVLLNHLKYYINEFETSYNNIRSFYQHNMINLIQNESERVFMILDILIRLKKRIYTRFCVWNIEVYNNLKPKSKLCTYPTIPKPQNHLNKEQGVQDLINDYQINIKTLNEKFLMFQNITTVKQFRVNYVEIYQRIYDIEQTITVLQEIHLRLPTIIKTI